MLDTNGRFPDRFAPPSVAADAAAAATARTGSETAKTGAETARTGAETARAGAETARTGAEAALAGVPAAVQTEVTTPGTPTRTALNATYVGIRTVDLESFLLSGETLPDDGTTDSRWLFQRALDQAAALVPTDGPVTIRIPSGQFRIDSSVRWFTGYHVGFVGAGRGNTRILPTGIAVFGLMDPSFDVATFLDDLVFADMTIDCSGQTSTLNQVGAKGISLRYMRNGLFERVRIINSWATSFGCDFLQDTSFIDCTAIGSGRGVVGYDSFGAGFGIGVGNFDRETVSFVNCHAFSSHSAGFFIERLTIITATPSASRGFSMTGCTAAGGYNGLRDAGGDGLLVTGCHFLNNTNAGVHIEGYSAEGRHGGRNGIISQSVIRGNGVGIQIGNAATGAYTFENNEVNENTGAGCASTSAGQLGAGWRWLDNRIERNGAGGIVLGSALVARPEIMRNVIRENGTGDGIRIDGDTFEPRIIDNVIQGHFGAGVSFPDATKFCTDPIIRGNVMTENSKGSVVNLKVTNDSTLITGNRETASFTTVTNLFTTPSYEVDVNLVSALSRFDAPVSVTGDAKYGTKFARLTVNQAGSPSARIGRTTTALSGVYTLSAWVRADKAAIIRPHVVGYWASNASQRTWHKGGIRATGAWQRVSLSVSLPADGSRLDLNIALDSATVGMVLDVDGVMFTKGTTLWPYIDGNQPNCAWTGTVGGSTSVLTIPA